MTSMSSDADNSDDSPARTGTTTSATQRATTGDSRGRIVIENVHPELDCGRYPVKRIVGGVFDVWADIFRDGHDVIDAVVRYETPSGQTHAAPMTHIDNDRWRGSFRATQIGRHTYTVEAWTNSFESWKRDTVKKRDSGQTISLELREAEALVRVAAEAAGAKTSASLKQIATALKKADSDMERAALLLSEDMSTLMVRSNPRGDVTRYHRKLEVYVDREAAGFSAWYEMFPRSQGTIPERSASFEDCMRRLPEIRNMGFDVLYLVPIHPIGTINRKGRNNAVAAKPGEPGSPYAIGSAEGGHDSIHTELGTFADFNRLNTAAHENGLELALDFAIQCAPDHPWIKEHPEWFTFRPDGTIKHAENPPKKYQDIVNVNFYGPHREALWNALKDVILFWVGHGVKIFRVDNPHTKPVPFWEWLIREVQTQHPDVIFLSEAFTRPKMLKVLAKAGFTQSYSYFTWRNFKQEFIDYLTELTQSECREYLRPNFFTNTPDILPPILQRGGRAAFQMRLVLAATLSSVYGIYNGFELCEAKALPNSEEYADSEKYQFKVWDWNREGNIKEFIARVNGARQSNPALREFLNLRFYPADSDSVLFYGKMTADRASMVFVAVNLDPFETHEATIEFPLSEMRIDRDGSFEAEELIGGERYVWRGARQRIRLDPRANPTAIFRITAPGPSEKHTTNA